MVTSELHWLKTKLTLYPIFIATTYLDVSVHMLRFLSQLRVVHRTHRHQKLKADLDQDAFQTHYLLFRHIELR